MKLPPFGDFQRDSDRGKRVQHIVHSCQIQCDFQILWCSVLAALRGEAHLAALMAHIHGADLRALAKSVSRHRLADARQNFTHVRIIYT